MRGVYMATICLFGASLLPGCGGSITVPAAAVPTASPTSAPAYPGQIYVNGAGSTIDVFSTEGSGNVAPSRVIAGSSLVAGTDEAGVWGVHVTYGGFENFGNLPVPADQSGGATHYSAAGSILAKIVLQPIPDSFGTEIVGAIAGATDAAGNFYLADGIRAQYSDLITEPPYNCEFSRRLQVDEFAADSIGTAAPIRTIGLPFNCSIWSLAVDEAGHLWVAGDDRILEFAADAAGTATPIRSIDFNYVFSQYIDMGFAEPGDGPSIAVDSKGNLYATIISDSETGILRYGVSSNKPELYLSDVYPTAVAFDAHDDLFVTGYFGAGRTGIAEFKYPGNVPLRIIAGSKTGGVALSPGLAVTR